MVKHLRVKTLKCLNCNKDISDAAGRREEKSDNGTKKLRACTLLIRLTVVMGRRR